MNIDAAGGNRPYEVYDQKHGLNRQSHEDTQHLASVGAADDFVGLDDPGGGWGCEGGDDVGSF